MTTLILHESDVVSADVNGHKFLSANIFYDGVEQPLPIFFKDKMMGTWSNGKIVIQGQLKEDVKPLRISIHDAIQIDLPQGNSWETFIVQYFSERGLTTQIKEYPDGLAISSCLEDYHIWANISKDRKTLRKMEFGRYLPLERPGQVRKTSNWTKGVFTVSNEYFITFLQTSWDGEDGDKYTLAYSAENEEKLLRFLEIPFEHGWVEEDYRLGKNGCYKASGSIVHAGRSQKWTFPLLDVGEQDMPFLFDRPFQWLRVALADSLLKYFWRHIDRTEVPPIKQGYMH